MGQESRENDGFKSGTFLVLQQGRIAYILKEWVFALYVQFFFHLKMDLVTSTTKCKPFPYQQFQSNQISSFKTGNNKAEATSNQKRKHKIKGSDFVVGKITLKETTAIKTCHFNSLNFNIFELLAAWVFGKHGMSYMGLHIAVKHQKH